MVSAAGRITDMEDIPYSLLLLPCDLNCHSPALAPLRNLRSGRPDKASGDTLLQITVVRGNQSSVSSFPFKNIRRSYLRTGSKKPLVFVHRRLGSVMSSFGSYKPVVASSDAQYHLEDRRYLGDR
jgi:hypothetical protein